MNELPKHAPRGVPFTKSPLQEDFAATLRASPGEWLPYPDEGISEGYRTNLQSRIKRGILVAFQPAGSFEARVRNHVLYVRCVVQ